MNKAIHKKIVITTIYMLTFCVTVIAQNHYIRPDATGNGSGSDWYNAYKNLPAVLNRGDTYYLADGNYGSYTFNDPEDGEIYITVKKATVEDHGADIGWLDNYGDEQAIFTPFYFLTPYHIIDGVTGGGGPESWESGLGIRIIGATDGDENIVTFRANGHYNMLYHIEIGNDVQPGSGVDRAVYSAQGADYNVFFKCYFHNTGNVGLTILYSTGWIFEYCRFDRLSRTSSQSHGTGIELSGTTQNCIIRYNFLTNIEGTGWIGIYGTNTGAVDGLYIYGNIFANTPDFSGGWGNGVIYNVSGTTEPLKNIKIYNNVFANLNTYAILGLTKDLGGSREHPESIGNEFINNIIWNVPAPGYNGGYTRNCNAGEYPISNDSNFQILTSNPFIDDASFNFKLKERSVYGALLPAPYNEDMLGTLRGSDNMWDRGAIEYVSETTNPPPVISSLSNVTCTEGELIDFNITVIDQNTENMITLQIQNLPQGADLIQISDREWNFHWQTNSSANENSPYSLTFIANNGSNDSSPESITITVSNIENDHVSALYHLDGNAQDSSGNSFHGVIYGSPSVVSGSVGEAYDFDGVDNYIESAWSSPIQGENQSFTIAAWVNAESVTGNHWIVGDDSNYRRFLFGLSSGTLAVRWRYGASNTDYSLNSGETIDGDWTHVAVTYDSTNRSVSIYINGNVSIEDTTTQPLGIREFNVLQIGRGFASSDPEYFDGMIDEVRIYNKHLSESDIYALVYSSENEEPVIESINPISCFEGEFIQFDITVTDADPEDTITLDVQGQSQGITLTKIDDRIWQFIWQTDFIANANSPYTITFTANDGTVDSIPLDVQITIQNVSTDISLNNKPDWFKEGD